MTSAKSLTKTAVLDASDNPEDQDKARERRVKMDFKSWRQQTKSGKKTHQEEVGISSAVAMKKAREEAKRKLLQDKAVEKQKAAFGDSDVKKEEKKWVDESDQAFKNVVAQLRAKHGKDSVLTKDSPKPKPQPKRKPKPQKPLTDAEKNQREVDARYGRTPWNPKGSLGT